MRRVLPFAVGLLIAAGPAHADYVVRDGNGNAVTIKSATVGPTQLPQSIPTDGTGTPYSSANPLASKPPGGNGLDSSANPPSLSGLTLLATMDVNPARSYLDIGVNCAAGLDVVLDDHAGLLTATIIPLAGPSVDGQQGGGYSTAFHTGRVRFYSSNAACQYWARQYP